MATTKKNEVEVIETTATDIVGKENPDIFKLKEPLSFESVEYTQLDLSGFKDLKGRDLKKINKMMIQSFDMQIMPEVTLEYVFAACATVCKLPLEFFDELSAKDCIRLKNQVVIFLFV